MNVWPLGVSRRLRGRKVMFGVSLIIEERQIGGVQSLQASSVEKRRQGKSITRNGELFSALQVMTPYDASPHVSGRHCRREVYLGLWVLV